LSERWPTIDALARSRNGDPLDNKQFQNPKKNAPPEAGQIERLQRWKRYTSARDRATIFAPANTAAAGFLSPSADMRGSAAPLTVRRITGHVQYAF
jgi:hypothetical protein